MANQVRLGGSFAPPLDAQKLADYRELAKSASDPRIQDKMLSLCEMMEVFHQTPASALSGSPHPIGEMQDAQGNKYRAPVVVPLEDSEVKRIWDYVPWDYECDGLGTLFETIPNETHKSLRDAAFHLLWFARELTRDREPLTNDKLQRIS